MAFCRLHNEYWAVNLESLGMDTLSNTETSKPCIISKHDLVVHKFNISLSKIVEWTSSLERGPWVEYQSSYIQSVSWSLAELRHNKIDRAITS